MFRNAVVPWSDPARIYSGEAGPRRPGPFIGNGGEIVKKNKEEKKERKPRRLTLNRETIQILDDPALLELAKGGLMDPAFAKTSMTGTQC